MDEDHPKFGYPLSFVIHILSLQVTYGKKGRANHMGNSLACGE